MAIIPQEIKTNKVNIKSLLKIIFLTSLVISFSIFLGVQVYRILNKTKIQKYFSTNEKFGILVNVLKDNKKKECNFLTVAIIHPKTSRIGFVSFYPDTKIIAEESTIREKATFNNINDLKEELSDLLKINIPFYIKISSNAVSKSIDLMNGIPFYIWKSDVSKRESLPTGEFLLTGDMAKKLLNVPKINEASLATTMFRHYNVMLNLWLVKKNKWDLIKIPEILSIIYKKLDTNISQIDIFNLGEIFFEEDWLPIFIEAPVKRFKDEFILNKPSFDLFYSKLQKQLVSKENPFYKELPKIEIRNGTNKAGLAKKYSNKLIRQGIRVLEFSNADRFDYQKNVLIDVNTRVHYLQVLKKYLNIKKVYFAIDRSLFTDLRLILGEDYKTIQIGKIK